MKFEKVDIELVEDSDLVGIYSVKKNAEALTEFENFLLKYKDDYPYDIGVIIHRLDIIKQDGCLERHFRYVGKRKDRTWELPSYFDSGKLRLFCVILSPNVILLGNGGVKTTKTYNEDPWLNSCAIFMQGVDEALKSKELKCEIVCSEKILKGNLSLEIKI